MELVNHLGIAASALPGMAVDGTPLLVLVAKACFDLPASGQTPRLAEVQPPVQDVDDFEGEPGLSPPLYESETAPLKPLCDVLLQGSAYAQGHNQSAQGVTVGMQVGSLNKVFEVWGERRWQRSTAGQGGWSLSQAKPYERLALSYALAYGGTDRGPDTAEDQEPWHANPVGLGFYNRLRQAKQVAGQLAAQTQPQGHRHQDPWTPQPSLSFGPVGRNWQPRLQQAGTFDDSWRQHRFPLLPEDFNPLHWQSAPVDQQLDALTPGLQIQLWNLTPDGHRLFAVPAFAPHVRCIRAGRTTARPMRADTLLLEPDLGRFSLIWRAHWPLVRSQPPIDRLELRHA